MTKMATKFGIGVVGAAAAVVASMVSVAPAQAAPAVPAPAQISLLDPFDLLAFKNPLADPPLPSPSSFDIFQEPEPDFNTGNLAFDTFFNHSTDQLLDHLFSGTDCVFDGAGISQDFHETENGAYHTSQTEECHTVHAE